MDSVVPLSPGHDSYEPRIIGLLCHWCSYAGADGAGAARLTHAPNLRPIRVMCSSRIDPQLVLQAFADGADGVLVAGCHPGDCHYLSGNYQAAARLGLLRRVLADLGIAPERLRLIWVSAGEGERWARQVDDFTARLRALGPLAWPARHAATAPGPEADRASDAQPDAPLDAPIDAPPDAPLDGPLRPAPLGPGERP